MPLVTNAAVRVEIENEKDWYEIRERLGWYQSRRNRMSDALQLSIDTKKADTGRVEPGDAVKVELSPADVQLRQFEAYIIRWSHKEPLTLANIKRIPPHHADAIQAKIRELEAAAAQEAGEVPTPSSKES